MVEKAKGEYILKKTLNFLPTRKNEQLLFQAKCTMFK